MLNLTGIESEEPKVLIPSPAVFGLADNMEEAMRASKSAVYADAAAKAMEPTDAVAKALAPPPSAFSFGYMAYMPDPQYGGLLPWPDIPPESLQKLVRTNLAPEMIISSRIADVLRYSNYSSHPWKPGWRIELRDAKKKPSTWDLKAIRECEMMIEACNTEAGTDIFHARARDAAHYRGFRTFLSTIVRDFLTYDAMAIWTDMDARGRIKGWTPLPAGNIRLADPLTGYKSDKSKFAVLIDQTGKPLKAFDREELIWYVGNPRVDPDIGDYPLSRVSIGMRLIDGFQQAFDLNSDKFSKNSFPVGMILLKGAGFTQNELDALARQVQNLKKGISKVWSLPAMVVPKDSEVEFMDLSAASGQEMLYAMYMNLVMGVFCLLYQFPVRKMGFHISGTHKDTDPLLDKNADAAPTDEEDIGLITLLGHLEYVLNQYIIWTRYPQLQLVFSGKAPREDAREYEARQLSMTWGEQRAQVDQPSLMELVDAMHEKAIAEAREKDAEKGKNAKPATKAEVNIKLQNKKPDKGKGDEEDALSSEDEPPTCEEECEAEFKELRKVARLLSLLPNDPSKASPYANIVTKMMAGGGGADGVGGGGGPESMFPSKKDPAAAEDKGVLSGTRQRNPSQATRERNQKKQQRGF